MLELCRGIQGSLRRFTAALEQLFDDLHARALLRPDAAPAALRPFLTDSGYASGRNVLVGADVAAVVAALRASDAAVHAAVVRIAARARAERTRAALGAARARREGVRRDRLLLGCDGAVGRLGAAVARARQACADAQHAAAHRATPAALVAYAHRVAPVMSAPWLAPALVARTQELGLPPMVLDGRRFVAPYPVGLERSILAEHSVLCPRPRPPPPPAPAATAAADTSTEAAAAAGGAEDSGAASGAQEEVPATSVTQLLGNTTAPATTTMSSSDFDDW